MNRARREKTFIRTKRRRQLHHPIIVTPPVACDGWATPALTNAYVVVFDLIFGL